MAIDLTCDCCGKDFSRRKSCVNEGENYCSFECSHEGRSEKITKPCTNCGVEVTRSPSDMEATQIFCSCQCRGEYNRIDGGRRDYIGDWQTKKKRAVKRANGMCEHPDCNRRECKYGYQLHVHHIIPNRYTNPETHEMSNLIVLCQEHHMELEPAKYLCG